MRGDAPLHDGRHEGYESIKSTDETDRDFAAMMKNAHQGAIQVGETELKSGKDPKMRAIAERIIGAQKKEIRELEEWLAKGR